MRTSTDRFSRRAVIGWSLAALGGAALAACSTPASPTAAPAKPVEPTKPAAAAPAATSAPAAAAGATTAPAPAAAKPAEATKPAAAPAAAAPASAAKGTIEYAAWGTADDNPASEQLAKDFMAKNPGITVKVNPYPSGEFYTKLQTAIAGGTLPDVFWPQGWEWQPYAARNVLVALDDFAARDKITGPFADTEGIKQQTIWEGKRYHVPLEVPTMVMFYAKKPFQEAGIPFPKDDWTVEQFLEIAQKLTSTGGGAKKFGYQANGGWFRDIHWIRTTGLDEFDTLVKPKKAQFNQPEIVKAVQLHASDVFNKLKISPTVAEMQGGANSIESGAAAMKYEGPWYFPTMNSTKLQEQKKGVEFDVVLMPKGADPKRRHRLVVSGLSIMKTANTDAAWEFTKYMTGEEGQKTFSAMTGRLPNNPDLIEKVWAPNVQKQFGVQNGKVFAEAFKSSMPDVIGEVPRSKMWAEVVKPVGWDPLVAGSATAADVLPKVDAALQKMLDEFWAKKG